MTDAADLFNPDAPRLSKDELRQVINTLRPDRRMNAGRMFFRNLLESDGVEGVYAFLQKAQVALDKQGELELFDFSEENGERAAFHGAREKLLTRRFVAGILFEGFGGAALAGYGLLGMGDQATRAARNEPLVDPEYKGRNGFEHAKHRLDETVMPSAYAAIGSGMVYLAGKNYYTHRLSDVENAVQRLADKIAQQPKHAPSAGRGGR